MTWREFGPIEDSNEFPPATAAPPPPASEPPPPVGGGNIIPGESDVGDLIGTKLDIPGKGVTGFHVSSDGEWSVGGTDIDSGVPRIVASVTDWDQVQLELWESAVQTAAGKWAMYHIDSTEDFVYIESGKDAGLFTGNSYAGVSRQVNTSAFIANVGNVYLGSDGSARTYAIFGERTAPSAPAANEISLYAKDVGGVTHLFAIDSSSTDNQLTGLSNAILSIAYAGNVV